MNKLHFVLIVVCAVFLSSALVSFTNADWTMFQHDPAHTGYTTVNATSQSLQELWNFSTGGNTFATLVAHGIVYVGSEGFFALNATTGTPIWNFSSYGYFTVYGYPCISNGTIYFGITDGYTFASEASTGAELWRLYTSNYEGFSGTVVNGEIFMATIGGLVIINASHHEEIGGIGGFGESEVSPAVVDNVVYGADNRVYAYDLADAPGPQGFLWTYPASNSSADQSRYNQTYESFSFRSSPTVADGVVYIGAEYNGSSGQFLALNASTGVSIWNYSTAGLVHSTPAVYGNYVYCGSLDGTVFALNRSDGSLVWSYKTGYGLDSSPAIAGGIVYVTSYNGTFYAFDAFNGDVISTYEVGSKIDCSPAISNNAVYITAVDGTVYAFTTVINPNSPTPTPTPTPSPSVPEFPTWLALPVFSAAAFAVVAVGKKRGRRP